METFTRWVYYFLESLGLDLSYMTNLNRLIVLVLIAVLAFLTDWICRKGIVRLVRKVTQKTKVTWDDPAACGGIYTFADRFPRRIGCPGVYPKAVYGVYYSGCFAVYQHFSGSHIPVGHTEGSIS